MDHYFEILLDFSNTVYLSIADAKVVDISIPANISNTFFQKKQTNDSKNLEINNIKLQLFFIISELGTLFRYIQSYQ